MAESERIHLVADISLIHTLAQWRWAGRKDYAGATLRENLLV